MSQRELEKIIYKQRAARNIARMAEKLDQFEVQKETSLLIDSLEPTERRQVMAALAERYGFKLAPQTTGSGNGPRPNYRKKRVY